MPLVFPLLTKYILLSDKSDSPCHLIMPSLVLSTTTLTAGKTWTSLDENMMVQAELTQNSECILCMTCVDSAQKTSSVMFSAPGSKNNKEDLPSWPGNQNCLVKDHPFYHGRATSPGVYPAGCSLKPENEDPDCWFGIFQVFLCWASALDVGKINCIKIRARVCQKQERH